MRRLSLKLVEGKSRNNKFMALVNTYLTIFIRLGIVFHGEENELMRLTVFGEDRHYRRLQTLEFDSDRKRMSTIVLFPDDSIWLLCKGAESAVVPRCIHGPIEETLDHINDYALVNFICIIFSNCDVCLFLFINL